MTETNQAGQAPTPAPLQIAIFGTTPSRMEGPYQDNSGWQRWTIGPGGKDAHNWDRLYEVHHVWPEDFKGYLSDLSQEKREVWSLAPMPELMLQWKHKHGKSDEQYAREIPGDWSSNRVIDRVKLETAFGRTWFSSSISWLFAQAIMEGAKTIGLWGIDLESGEEYQQQFYGCRYFIDLASKFLGVNVELPTGCGLMREPRAYPERYEINQALHWERKVKNLSAMLGGMESEYDGLRAATFRTEGKLLWQRETGASTEVQQATEQELLQLNGRLGSLAASINHLKGNIEGFEYNRRMYVHSILDPELKL